MPKDFTNLAVDVQRDDADHDVIHITIDLTEYAGSNPVRSASGKTYVVASTRGNTPVDTPVGRVFVGVNAFQYPPDRE